MGTAHHMLLYGCKEPGQRETLFRFTTMMMMVARVMVMIREIEAIFSCGEMGRVLEGTKQATPCRSGDIFGHFVDYYNFCCTSLKNDVKLAGQEIIYAWARNAPKLELPPAVGFKVGGPASDVKYLVLQVHFLFDDDDDGYDGDDDNSGGGGDDDDSGGAFQSGVGGCIRCQAPHFAGP